MLDLVRNGPAVGIAKPRQGVLERLTADVRVQHLGRDQPHDVGREPHIVALECGITGRLTAEWVQLGSQISMGSDALDDGDGGRDVMKELGGYLRAKGGRRSRGGRRDSGSGGLLDVHRCCDALVEALLVLKQSVHELEEHPGLRALDDSMVVGAGYRHDPGAPEFADRTRGNDRSLALHEAGHGGNRPDGTRIRQRHGGAHIGIGQELVVPRTTNQPLVLSVELGERQLLCVPDNGHEQLPLTLLSDGVHGDAEIHRARSDAEVVFPPLGDRVCHRGMFARSADDGPSNDVGERELEVAILQRAIQCSANVPEE